jgi:hypothetical protein
LIPSIPIPLFDHGDLINAMHGSRKLEYLQQGGSAHLEIPNEWGFTALDAFVKDEIYVRAATQVLRNGEIWMASTACFTDDFEPAFRISLLRHGLKHTLNNFIWTAVYKLKISKFKSALETPFNIEMAADNLEGVRIILEDGSASRPIERKFRTFTDATVEKWTPDEIDHVADQFCKELLELVE